MRRPPRPRVRTAALLGGLVGILLLTSGCITRLARDPLLDGHRIKLDLVREVKGFTTQPQGFDHPAIVSKERLVHILNAVEVETREDGGALLRQPAFHPDIVEEVAESLSNGLAEASPDQEVSVVAVRKEMRLGILHRKYLTSCLAHVDDDHLYLRLARVDWQIPRNQERKPWPKPRRDEAPMDFRVVSGDLLYYLAPQELEIAWQDAAFRRPYRLPGSTEGQERRREILEESPIRPAERERLREDEDPIGTLTPEQLRALADLEEDRRAGRITEAAYQRARRQLLRSR